MLDQASQEHGRLVDLTTDNVVERDRFGYWRDAVLRRNRPEKVPGTGLFTARLRRVVLPDVELIEHASESIVSGRSTGRTRFEGGDDIAIELMRRGRSNLTHNGEHRLKAGDMWLVDYALPLRTELSRHRACGVVLSRRSVQEVLGGDLSRLGGQQLSVRGLGAVVRAHMTTALDEAPYMSSEQRIAAVRALAGMALVALQNARFGAADPEQLGEGLYRTALAVIKLHCASSDLSPERIALMVGCSRASLYRLFANRDQGVAEAIWQARLERVHRELSSAAGVGMTIGELALQCGFSDLSSFGRMFKRRYGLTPQEARRSWLEAGARSTL